MLGLQLIVTPDYSAAFIFGPLINQAVKVMTVFCVQLSTQR